MRPVRLKSTVQKLRSRRYTHAHTHTHTHTLTHSLTHTHTHTHIHTEIFQNQCILIPENSKQNYNMFLQQLKKLLSQSFLQEEAIMLITVDICSYQKKPMEAEENINQLVYIGLRTVLARSTQPIRLVRRRRSTTCRARACELYRYTYGLHSVQLPLSRPCARSELLF